MKKTLFKKLSTFNSTGNEANSSPYPKDKYDKRLKLIQLKYLVLLILSHLLLAIFPEAPLPTQSTSPLSLRPRHTLIELSLENFAPLNPHKPSVVHIMNRQKKVLISKAYLIKELPSHDPLLKKYLFEIPTSAIPRISRVTHEKLVSYPGVAPHAPQRKNYELQF